MILAVALVAARAVAQLIAMPKPNKRLSARTIQSARIFSRALLTRENRAKFKANLLERISQDGAGLRNIESGGS